MAVYNTLVGVVANIEADDRCTCGHVRYLHRPGWCRGYGCNCYKFALREARDD